jgi:hypothetical protein
LTLDTAVETGFDFSSNTSSDTGILQGTGVETGFVVSPDVSSEIAEVLDNGLETGFILSGRTSIETSILTDSAVVTGYSFSVDTSTELGIIEVSVDETEVSSSVQDVDVEPGVADVSVSESVSSSDVNDLGVTGGPVDLQIRAVDSLLSVERAELVPGNVDVGVVETVLFTDSEETGVENVINIDSPTSAVFRNLDRRVEISNLNRESIITNKDRFVVMSDHTFKQGDLGDELEAVLKDENGVLDLSQVSKVELVMQDRSGVKVLDEEVTISNGVQGEVEYQWSSGDPIEEPGVFRVEFRITDSVGDTETVPNDGFNVIEVEEEIG